MGVFLPTSKPETGKDPGTAMIGSCQRALPCSSSFISVVAIKFPNKLQVREERGFIPGDSPLLQEKSQQQGLESAGHIIATVRSRETGACKLTHSPTCAQFMLYSYRFQGPALEIAPTAFSLGVLLK